MGKLYRRRRRRGRQYILSADPGSVVRYSSSSSRYRKRKYTGAKRMVMYKSPSGIPDRIFVKLKYADHVTFPTAGTNGCAVLNYKGNACDDPGGTNDDHKALAFGEWGNLYNKYRVHGSKIVMTVSATRNTAYAPSNTDTVHDYSVANFMYYVSVKPSNNSGGSNPLSINNQCIDPYVRYALVGFVNGGGSQKTLKNYMSTKKILGVKSMDEDDELSAATSSDPSSLWYWVITATESDGSTQSGATTHLQLLIKIDYYVELYSRKNLDMDTN